MNEKMSYRIAIGGFEHETNTYLAETTDLEDFILLDQQEIISTHQGRGTYIGGMLRAACDLQVEAIPLYHAFVQEACSGTIKKEAYKTIKETLLNRLEEALPVDAVCLALHGAGVCEGIQDIEKDIIESVRNLVGDNVVIGATFDLHGNVTENTFRNLNLAYCLNNAPHTDMAERGYEAITGIVKTLSGEITPNIQLVRLPLLMAPISTEFGIGAELKKQCQNKEKIPGIIDCACFHGFPYDDIDVLGTSVIVMADKNQELAKKTAHEVANFIWKNKESFRTQVITPKQAIAEAEQIIQKKGGPVVIADGSDNPGGGGPCNSTHLLKALLVGTMKKVCFAVIKDSKAVEIAWTSGVGSEVSISLGGNNDDIHGDPVSVRAVVKKLTDGRFKITSEQRKGEMLNIGKTALLGIGNMDLIISEQRHQPFDPEVFVKHGLDYREYDIVALKSTNHWRAGFPDISGSVVAVTAGYMSLDLFSFERKNLKGLYWPLADRVEYKE